MMAAGLATSLATASLILFAGVIDDLRSRKVHNWLFLACTAIAVLVNVGVGGWSGLNTAFLGFVAGFLGNYDARQTALQEVAG